MSRQLVPFGRSWYVPVHDVPGHRAVGRRPRAPGRAGRDARGRRTASPRRPSCCAPTASTRIVATGNGAAYYVAHALWLASLEGERGRPADRRGPMRHRGARAASGGSPATRCWRCPRPGSSATWSRSRSAAPGGPCVAITAAADSSLAAAATATVLQRVVSQRAVTHTQALAGAYACGLALWAAVTRRRELARAAGRPRPTRPQRAVADAEAWAGRSARRPGGAAGRDRRGRRHRVGGGARAGADAQGDRAHPRRGRRDARGRDVGDVRPRTAGT